MADDSKADEGPKADLASLWLSEASKERIRQSFAAEITDGLEAVGRAEIVVLSTRLPRIRIGPVMEEVSGSARGPVVVVCHAGGEQVALQLLQLGATSIIAEGDEAVLRQLVPNAGPGRTTTNEDGVATDEPPSVDPEPLVTGFAQRIENLRAGTLAGGKTDETTRLPLSASFEVRFAELGQRDQLPRLGYITVANAEESFGQLDRPTFDLVRRRLALLFQTTAAEYGAEMYQLGELEFAYLGPTMDAGRGAEFSRRLVDTAGSFSPSGTDGILLAVGHAGPEVAGDPRTLRELADRAVRAAETQNGGVVSGDELARSQAGTTELETAFHLARWVSEHDRYSEDHAAAVADLAVRMGHELGMDGLDLVRLRLAANLHDIGKIGLDPEILEADPEQLDGEQAEAYRSHPEKGGKFVLLSAGEVVAAAIHRHHENFDGSGFPDGMSGEEIPFPARVIAAADTCRVLIDGDTPLDSVIEQLEEASGTRFDPTVAKAAITVLQEDRGPASNQTQEP
ncbi:MAG TPA: HD domain-containing protein [Acidimicrobiales bacterium]|nr:HD domain-containing protein [Acidimicrobiales bacterium]